jgi:flagellar protein FlaG
MNINPLNTQGYGVSQSTTPASLIKKAPDAEKPIAAPIEAKAIVESEQIREAAEKIQNSVDNLAQKNLRFSIDEDTGKTIIKVVDAHTDELIKQIPSEEAVEIARTLDKVQGLLLNDKA